jgi:hypothetical protein
VDRGEGLPSFARSSSSLSWMIITNRSPIVAQGL